MSPACLASGEPWRIAYTFRHRKVFLRALSELTDVNGTCTEMLRLNKDVVGRRMRDIL